MTNHLEAVLREAREPTEAMLNAARDWSIKKYGMGIGNDAAKDCWKVMFDAALSAASGEASGDDCAECGVTAERRKRIGICVNPKCPVRPAPSEAPNVELAREITELKKEIDRLRAATISSVEGKVGPGLQEWAENILLRDIEELKIRLKREGDREEAGVASIEAILGIPEAHSGYDYGTINRAIEAMKTRIAELEAQLERQTNAAIAVRSTGDRMPNMIDAEHIGEAIRTYIDEYEFRGDGGDYTPKEYERELLDDAINGLPDEVISLLAAPQIDAARAEGIAAERERIAKWFEDKRIEEGGVDWGLSDHDERQSIKDHNRRVKAYAASIREAKP